jgi:hypothetical protein
MKSIFENGHITIMRHVAKAARRGDFAEVERLTRIADRLHRMQHRSATIDEESRQLKNDERRIRTARLKHWTPSSLS